MNLHTLLNDMGAKVTKDLMDPIVEDFQNDISYVVKRLEEMDVKLDKIIKMCEDWK